MNTLRNKVQLTGHLGTEINLKTLTSGVKLASMSIATTERYLSKGEWKADTQWHRLVFWDQLAEQAEKSLGKGSFVQIEGKLNYRSYVDVKGETIYITEIRVSHFLCLEKTHKSETGLLVQ